VSATTTAVKRALTVFAVVLLCAAGARAQDEAVAVEITRCEGGTPGWDEQQMLAIVRVEIAPRQLATAESGANALVIDACDPSRLLLRYKRGAEAVEHVMPLDDVPVELKPRVAALAIAELAGGADALTPPAPPAREPAPAPPPPRPRRRQPISFDEELLAKPEPPARTDTWLGLGAEGRVFFSEPGPSFGPRLTLALRYVQIGIVGLLGRQTVAAGDVTTGVAAAALDIPLWRPLRTPGVSIAAGGELGVTWAKGKLRDEQESVTSGNAATFASALMRLNWGGRVARSAYAQVAWALGYARGMHARAEGRLAASTHGGFVTMTVTIAWAP
jgi:hypothetical protein